MAEQPAGESGAGFRGLLAWQKADALASLAFRTFQKVAPEYRWFSTQAMKAAVSVPAKIAEGHGRGSLGDYVQFLESARGTLAEFEYYLHFAVKEGLISSREFESLEGVRSDAGRVLAALLRATRAKGKPDWDRGGFARGGGSSGKRP
jgi:four helix bundle protein